MGATFSPDSTDNTRPEVNLSGTCQKFGYLLGLKKDKDERIVPDGLASFSAAYSIIILLPVSHDRQRPEYRVEYNDRATGRKTAWVDTGVGGADSTDSQRWYRLENNE